MRVEQLVGGGIYFEAIHDILTLGRANHPPERVAQACGTPTTGRNSLTVPPYRCLWDRTHPLASPDCHSAGSGLAAVVPTDPDRARTP